MVDIPNRPEMYKVGMIVRFIEAGEDTKNKVLLEINKIRDKLNEGADFAELADEYSDGPSASNGGNLGFFGKGMMVKPFEDAAFALMPGEISEVIETQFGYHIIKVLEKKGNEVNASHILKIVEATENDVQANIQLMEGVLQKLAEGEDFTDELQGLHILNINSAFDPILFDTVSIIASGRTVININDILTPALVDTVLVDAYFSLNDSIIISDKGVLKHD